MINSAIAIGSLFIALWFGGIEVVEYVVAVDVSVGSVAVHFDPVFLVWDEDNSIPGSAVAFGNTIVIEERWRGTEHEDYLMVHEMIHVRQFQSLGWCIYPALWFDILDIESRGTHTDWNRPEENYERMWVPTIDSPRWYHFFTVEARFG